MIGTNQQKSLMLRSLFLLSWIGVKTLCQFLNNHYIPFVLEWTTTPQWALILTVSQFHKLNLYLIQTFPQKNLNLIHLLWEINLLGVQIRAKKKVAPPEIYWFPKTSVISVALLAEVFYLHSFLLKFIHTFWKISRYI